MMGVTLDREDGSTPMETDGGDKGKQGTNYFIDTNQLRVARENMEVMSPLKNGMSESLFPDVIVGNVEVVLTAFCFDEIKILIKLVEQMLLVL